METKIKNFQTWYKRLDRQHRIEVREAFLEQSGMSYASWHPKVRNGKFSPLQIKLLESIAGQTF